jgi:hypothetical protein
MITTSPDKNCHDDQQQDDDRAENGDDHHLYGAHLEARKQQLPSVNQLGCLFSEYDTLYKLLLVCCRNSAKTKGKFG